jgi:hypothetical protein
VLLVAATPAPASLFYEDNGVVSMETEHATASTGWVSVSGVSGTARRDAGVRGVDGMDFEINFAQGGRFYVWLLCRHTSSDGATADDAFVTLDGQKLYGSDDVTRPDGMQAASGTFSWSSRPKGPGGTTPSNIAAGPVYFQVPGPGRRVLRIGSRSQGFEIDKVVLRFNDATRPTGNGPAETLAGGTSPPPESAPPPSSPPPGGAPATPSGGSAGEGENGDGVVNDTLCGGSAAVAPGGHALGFLAAGIAALLLTLRKRPWICLLGAPGILAGAGSGPAPKVFVESEGLVSMEAEHATVNKGWADVAGSSGRAMRDEGQGSLEFEIFFTRGGKFHVWMLCRDQGNTETNDCFVTLSGQRLYAADDKTRPDGIRSAGAAFTWVCRPKGPGGHTPDAIKSRPVYALVPGPGRHTLKVAHRSKGFEVDKIVLLLEGKAPPEGQGPAETEKTRTGGGK